MSKEALIPLEVIQSKIYHIRGHNVMLDKDLAELYQVETKALKQAVRRNLDRFPEHFMFELTKEEFETLRSQTVTSKTEGRGGTRYLPMVFTEHGTLQLANILRSERAKQMGIRIIEVFVRMRAVLLTNKEILKKLAEIEKSQLLLGSNDKKQAQQIDVIFKYIQGLENAKKQKGAQEGRKKIGY